MFLHHNKFNDRRLYFQGTGGRFLLTGQDCPPQTGHNDFDHRAGTGPGFFIITTGHEASGLWVADGSHKDVYCSDKRKAKIVKASRLKLISIPANSVFVGHGFLQHAGAG